MYFLFHSRYKKDGHKENISGNKRKTGDTAHVRILYLNGIN